jgi:hypothetical protein
MFDVVSRFTKLLFASTLMTAFFAGIAATPGIAQANKLSKSDRVALRHEIASCKSQAKHKKIQWRLRRQFVVDCVQAHLNRPSINVRELMKNHPDLKGLPCLPNPDPGYKLAC